MRSIFQPPWLRRTEKQVEDFYKRQLHRVRRVVLDWQMPYRPQGRKWGCALPLTAVRSLQAGTLAYSYRGIPMLKNPIEVALYQLLIWQLRPRTVIEIGSYLGASAYWLADILRTFEIGGTVISIDIDPPAPHFERSDVRFIKGDARDLGAVLTPAVIKGFDRPLLIIDDSIHSCEGTLAVMEFAAPVLRSGEYMIVEDGLVSDLGMAGRYGGGPGLAISRFLASHPEFVIDTSFCDRYGHNFTGNPNGYLRHL
jgi:cephalosporin hydroxylase